MLKRCIRYSEVLYENELFRVIVYSVRNGIVNGRSVVVFNRIPSEISVFESNCMVSTAAHDFTESFNPFY